MKYDEEIYAVVAIDPANGHASLASYDLSTLETALDKADRLARHYVTHTRFDGRECNDVYVVAKVEVTEGMFADAVKARRKVSLEKELADARKSVDTAGSRLSQAQELYDRAVDRVEELEEELDG